MEVRLYCFGQLINDHFPVLAVPRVGETVTSDALPRFGCSKTSVVIAVEHDSTGNAPVINVFLRSQ